MANSKWSPANITQPSPMWVKIMRWIAISVSPILATQIPTMPVGEHTKYWLFLGNTLLVSFCIAIGEGFKSKTLNERATERNQAETAGK